MDDSDMLYAKWKKPIQKPAYCIIPSVWYAGQDETVGQKTMLVARCLSGGQGWKFYPDCIDSYTIVSMCQDSQDWIPKKGDFDVWKSYLKNNFGNSIQILKYLMYS